MSKLDFDQTLQQALIDNIPNCIALVLKKSTREIVASNKLARDMGAIPGERCFVRCSLRDSVCPWCLAPDLWETDKTQYVEIEYEGRWYEGRWSPFTKDLYLHYITDITERKKSEETNKHTRDLLNYIIEHTRSAVAIHDRNLNYLYVSQRYLEEFHIQESNIIGKHHYEVFPDLPQKWRDVHQRVLQGEVLSAEEDSYPKDDGSVEWTRWECRPWYLQDGSIGGLIVYTEVITDRILAAEHLRENEKKYRALFDKAAHGIVVANADTGIIVSCNNKIAEILGWEVEEIVGRHQSFLHPVHGLDGENSKTFKAHSSIAAGQILEDQLICKDGSLVDIEIMASPLSIGSQHYIQGFFYDIRDRKRLMEDYRRSTQLAALGTIAAGVAHEINNPIQGIINYATLIGNAPDRAERIVDMAGRIVKEGNRIASITRDLLHYARDNREELRATDILEPITAAVSLVSLNFKHSGITIKRDFPATPVFVRANPQWVQQVVVNLVENSFDAVLAKGQPDEAEAIKVVGSVVEEGQNHWFRLEVLDHGIGIPATNLGKVQDAFFTTKQETKGSGLGLSIVGDIVSKHHGTLEIESEEGLYTRVIVNFPVLSPG